MPDSPKASDSNTKPTPTPTPTPASVSRSGAKTVLFTLLIVALPILVVALFEGLSSLVLAAYTLASPRFLAEARHTERDTLLGWINRPNLSLPSMYGPGVGLHTNRQRVRHLGDLAPNPPAGRRRLLCSGDSFTLGYGVDDEHPWCSLLGVRDSSWETVNMGQGGYGMDQAYLWYLRDGLPLHPDLHVFALITEDLRRNLSDNFSGNPKPRLVLDSSGLHTVGVPVAAPGLRPWWKRVMNNVRALRSFDLLQRLGVTGAGRPSIDNRAMRELGLAVLRDLARRDSAAGIELVVVHLPTRDDFNRLTSDPWLQQAHEAARRGEFRFVDLIEPFRRLPLDSVEKMFIKDGEVPYASAVGHFNVVGNAWVADQLTGRLPPAATK